MKSISTPKYQFVILYVIKKVRLHQARFSPFVSIVLLVLFCRIDIRYVQEKSIRLG